MVADFNTALSVLENATRRTILEHLVREPHYPLQLSELVDVTQQAVMKHLKVLQAAGFVTCETVPSEKGGPPKKLYSVQQSFSLRLDLGPDLFRCEHRLLPMGGPVRLSSRLPKEALSIVETMGTRRRLPMAEAMGLLEDLTAQLESLDSQRDALIALHQQVMSKVSRTVDDDIVEYNERQLAFALLEAPTRPLDLDQFSRDMRIQTTDAEEMMDTLRTMMMREVGVRRGHVIAAREGVPLPWWVILD